MRRIRYAVLLLLVAFLPVYAGAESLTVSVSYPPSEKELVNPFIGNVAWASDPGPREQPFTLVYADLTWAEFEPEEGVYDFAAFEEANLFSQWLSQGKHVIFRFVMDRPGSKKHRDIPNWLYEKTGKDGEAYNVSYGRGYSPDYSNPELIKAHAKAIAALGERYGKDSFFAYVQIGSLGHWGEWHVHDKLPSFPLEEVRNQYVTPYLTSFPKAKLMMRRPFAIAKENGMGLFNDAAGDPDSTETWLDWIAQGGVYNQTGEENGLSPMPEAWLCAPIGGELTTSTKAEHLLSDNPEETLTLFERSHTSWIGPGSFVNIARGGTLQTALDRVNRTIGYRLRVSACKASQGNEGGVSFLLTFENDGSAPFYFDWPACLRIQRGSGEAVLPLDFHLADVVPGTAVSVSISADKTILPKGEWIISVGIMNPDTQKPGIALAMDTAEDGLWYELMRVTPGI